MYRWVGAADGLAYQRPGPRLECPLLFEGTCNTEVFKTWLSQQLCPPLTERQVIVLDNAAFHKSAKTRELITDRGARLLFLPPYSPDLNPIQRDFATLKKRRQYHPLQSLDDLIRNYR